MSIQSTTTQAHASTIVLVEPDQNALLQKLAALEADLNGSLIERETVVQVLLCAVIAEQHAVLLGPPGTGKSTAINALAAHIDGGGSVFKLLLDKFTDVGAVFGPLSIPGLMAEEQRRSLKYGAASGSRIWFLDEIWKSSNALLNALLTALEERAIDNDGKRIALDLVSCFGASNEPPQDDSLRALRDRFALCVNVSYVSDRGFIQLSRLKLARQSKPISATITLDDLAALHALRRSVTISDHVVQTMTDLRRQLRDDAVIVSDRRMLVAYDILAAHALLCGRLEVKEADYSILAHVLWSAEHEREKVEQAVRDLNNRDKMAESIAASAASAYSMAASDHGASIDGDVRMSIAIGLMRQLRKMQTELTQLAEDANRDGQATTVIARYLSTVNNLITAAREMV